MNTYFLNKANLRNTVKSGAPLLLRYIARYWGLCLFFLLANAAVLNGQIEVSEDISGKAVITDPVSVKLINGFHAQAGSAFRAYIGPSQGQVSSYTIPAAPQGTVPPILSEDYNYIKTIIYREPKTSEPTTAFKQNTEIAYFDGLGRPMQTVSVGASPNKNDIIQAILYDNFGREIYKPLPYAAPNKTGEFRAIDEVFVSNYYKNNPPIGVETNNLGERAYTQYGYDNSPLNRMVTQTGAGKEWDTKPVRINYLTNASDETVTGWKINAGGSYESFTYPVNSLYVTETIDEQGNKTREYKDKQGKVVQKSTWLKDNIWYNTHYIYDNFDLLRCVISPQATNPNTPDPNTQTQLCYYYKYDERHRMIEKKIPGGGTVSMVYDKRDRLRCTQNSEQYLAKEWSFIQYDELNRPVITGIIKNYIKTPQQVKTELDAIAQFNETYNGNASYYGYNHTSFPGNLLTLEVQSVTYYDNDLFINALQLGDSLKSEKYDAGIYNFASKIDKTPIGQITGTMTRALCNPLENYAVPDQMLFTTNHYDKYGHLLRSISENHLKGKDVISNIYEDITYLVISNKQQHFKGGKQTIIEKAFDFDHTGRLLATREKVNNAPAETILNAMVYNELGQLVIKYLHSSDVTESRRFAQKVDYRYNIRGWLTKINDPALGGENDLFGIQLCYNNTSELGQLSNTQGCYNGNISGMKWSIKNDPAGSRGYGFTYDRLNRLFESNYAEGNSLSSKAGYYNETVSEYDKNGNIMRLKRVHNNDLVDDLTYAYVPGSNRLSSVTDPGVSNGLLDDYPGNSLNYGYDENGNMTYDGSRHFDFEYINTLNLPSKISSNNPSDKIYYHYTAGGAKLLKHVMPASGNQAYTHYIGNIIYEGGKLSYIITEEGRLVNVGTNANPSFVHEYNLKDHLGNNRVTFLGTNLGGGALEVLQSTDYYPFGLTMNQYQNENNSAYPKNKYLYNGKEIQDDELNGKFFGMLDYGARFYDPQIGRFPGVDPIIEKFPYLTPYNYASNNPVTNIDLWGLQGISAVQMSSDLNAAYKANPESYKKMVNTTLTVAGLVFPAARLGQLGILAGTGKLVNTTAAAAEVYLIQVPTMVVSGDKLINGENSTYEGGTLPTILMNEGGPGMKKAASIIDAAVSLGTIGIPKGETGIVSSTYDVIDAGVDTYNAVKKTNSTETSNQKATENSAAPKKEEQPKTEDQKDKDRSGMYIFPINN